MSRYAMVIHLGACVGCQACMAACAAENQSPFWDDKFRTQVEDDELGWYPNPKRVFLPRLCLHCDKAPCVDVCPTGASFYNEDGLVLIDEDKCILCGYCVAACPFDARYFYEGDNFKIGKEKYGDTFVHFKEAVDKCTFCEHRLRENRKPACVETCPTGARIFGDLEKPDDEVRELVKSGRAREPVPELKVGGNVYYVYEEPSDLKLHPSNDYTAPVSRIWKHYFKPVAAVAMAAGAVGLAAAIPKVRKNVEEHFTEVEQQIAKKRVADQDSKEKEA